MFVRQKKELPPGPIRSVTVLVCAIKWFLMIFESRFLIQGFCFFLKDSAMAQTTTAPAGPARTQMAASHPGHYFFCVRIVRYACF